jgi:hypothetical protein
MRTSITRRAALAALAMVALGATACDDDSTSPREEAHVRFVHAAAGTEAVDFRVEDTNVREDVAYADAVSDYGAVATGSLELAARLTDGTTDLASATEDLLSGGQYTVVLVKQSSGEAIAIFADTNTAAASGKTRLRVINAAPSAQSVDVYVTDADADLEDATAAVTDVAPEEASKYVEIDEGTQRVRFTTTGSKTVMLDLEDFELPDGGVRTIMLLDDDEGGTPLQSITAEDRG